MGLTRFSDDARILLGNLGDFASGFVNPSVRLGVTGLSRSGKTVFITALVHNLIHGGRLPLFKALSDGRISNAYLQPQPDDGVPRFSYEDHLVKLVEDKEWPKSTDRISQLRLTIDFEAASFFTKTVGGGRLNIDIVDYPGEWLLDLPLLTKDYQTWSSEAIALAKLENRTDFSKPWLQAVGNTDLNARADETEIRNLSGLFTTYLKECRADERALSMLPPGRFLMPGDLRDSPAVTFAPLPKPDETVDRGSLYKLMERRYESYKQLVVQPFFRDHFARLDRQIILVDALQALNAGPEAVKDLETALTEILLCFNPGRSSWLFSILSRRIDRLLFAATKADHLHREDHDNLQRVLQSLVSKAIERAKFAGAKVDVTALASVRATREATFKSNGDELACIAGVPLKGEQIDGEIFDGIEKKAIYPGSLADVMKTMRMADAPKTDLRFIRFRPPEIETTAEGLSLSLPHIRLDRALEFLLGDKLQ